MSTSIIDVDRQRYTEAVEVWQAYNMAAARAARALRKATLDEATTPQQLQMALYTAHRSQSQVREARAAMSRALAELESHLRRDRPELFGLAPARFV